MLERFDVLLLPQVSHLGLTLLTEPLFLANWLSGAPLYGWRRLSMDGAPVVASSGESVPVDAALADADDAATLLVTASFEPKAHARDGALLAVLRRRTRHGGALGGIETGSEVLARAGLLDGYRAAVHWDNAYAFRQTFPEVTVTDRPFEIDRGRITSSGALANLELMLHLIGSRHGPALPRDIARHLQVALPGGPSQPGDLRHGRHRPVTRRRVNEAIAQMEAHLEEPLPMGQVAAAIGVSLRQMERDFHMAFGVSPGRYFLTLRLNHAHHLLQQSDLSVTEVAMATGFGSLEHFSRSYRRRFGQTPSRDRRQTTDAPVARLPAAGAT